MKDKTLAEYIRKMNNGGDKELIFINPLSIAVDYAKVWWNKPKPTDKIVFPDGPYCMYFIKNELDKYVAVVLDMGNDLHAYVITEYRKMGYLTKALRNSILPHIFEEKEEQRITITKDSIGENNFEASQKVALSLGFIPQNNNEYLLSSEEYMFPPEESVKRSFSVTKERMEVLKRRMNYIAKSLWTIQSEVEMCFNDSLYAEELKEMVDDLKLHCTRIEDCWWERKMN